jgi:pimeloyl-ACP methyl ester carboxylesterase
LKLYQTLRAIVVMASVLALASCTSSRLPASAKLEHPVIFVPGMPGSLLKSTKDDEVLWGRFQLGRTFAQHEGGRLAVPILPGDDRADGPVPVVPSGVLERIEVNFLGLITRWQIYEGFLQQVKKLEPDPERGKFFHCFAYDWRLDCAGNARLLHQFMDRTAAQLKRDFPERFRAGEEVRFDIVAHSMGGLLARYALCYGDVPLETALQRRGGEWRSAGRCRKLIMVNPVNGGSLRAFQRLIKGYTYGPMLPQWSAGMLGTLPALYQLLPAEPDAIEVEGKQDNERVSVWDAQVWKDHGWGMFSPKAQKDVAWLSPGLTGEKRDALVMQHMSTCLRRAKDFRSALDGASCAESGIEFDLLIGTARQTARTARFDKELHAFIVTDHVPGDGLVTLRSALAMPGLALPHKHTNETPHGWHTVYFGRRNHIGAMNTHNWIQRILRLLTIGEPAGRCIEPARARGFFDRSLR